MKNSNDSIIKSTLSSIIRDAMIANNGVVSVIDYGCGYAPYADYIQNICGAEYLGVDISVECLEFVQQNGYRACKPDQVGSGEEFDILLF